MPELGQLDQQGRELFNTVTQSPFAQIATNYGKDMLKNSKVCRSLLDAVRMC